MFNEIPEKSLSSQTIQPHREGKRLVFANGASITGDWGLLVIVTGQCT